MSKIPNLENKGAECALRSELVIAHTACTAFTAHTVQIQDTIYSESSLIYDCRQNIPF